MTNRPRAITASLVLLAASAIGCTTGAAGQPTWILYSPGPIATPQPTVPPTPVPSPTAPPVAQETVPPPDCPSSLPAQPMHLHDLTALDALCFGTATITVIGWQAAPGEFDWEGPTIEPGWLIYPTDATRSALWDGRPDSLGRCYGIEPCVWSTVAVVPGSGVTFNGLNRWVKVTGHLNDPGAAQCRYVWDPITSPQERLPDSDAQHWCASTLVVEHVEVTTAP
jgi:hypothetical protein